MPNATLLNRDAQAIALAHWFGVDVRLFRSMPGDALDKATYVMLTHGE